MQGQKSEWNRLVFPISQRTGLINNKLRFTLMDTKKLDIDEIRFILALIMKESHKFVYVRWFTKIKTFVYVVSFALIVILVYFLTVKKYIKSGVVSVIFVLFYGLYVFYVKKLFAKYYRKVHKKLFPLIDSINRKLLGSNNLYLMINDKFKYVYIYHIPNYIKNTLKPH